MPHRSRTEHHLNNIISFRVNDEELDLLERLRGDRNTRLSCVLRDLLKQVLRDQQSTGRRRNALGSQGLTGLTA